MKNKFLLLKSYSLWYFAIAFSYKTNNRPIKISMVSSCVTLVICFKSLSISSELFILLYIFAHKVLLSSYLISHNLCEYHFFHSWCSKFVSSLSFVFAVLAVIVINFNYISFSRAVSSLVASLVFVFYFVDFSLFSFLLYILGFIIYFLNFLW